MQNIHEILMSIDSRESRIARLHCGKLVDLSVERKKSRQISGNIYKGKVTNILSNIQSAFIDIKEKESGFIHISDVLENSQKMKEMFEIDFDWEQGESEKPQDISSLFKVDQFVLVQVVKDPIGTKGARLTSNISIAGRYLVLLPNSSLRGVSRKIRDVSIRNRLRQLIEKFHLPSKMGLICRTSSVHATTEQLIHEVEELIRTFDEILENYHKSKQPKCLYQESDLTTRILFTAMDKGYQRILVDHQGTFNELKRLYQRYPDHEGLKIEFYRDKQPLFEKFGIDREIDKALKRKLWLPNGSYLFFESTEAMHTIDVNSGKGASNSSGDVEESLVQINMEAAAEIARQLRLRNIGGLIVIDFIDMRSAKSQKRVLEAFKEALAEDSAKCTVLGISEFGIVEMTRQRNRESLFQTVLTTCPYCSGLGKIKNLESISIEIERAIKSLISKKNKGTYQLWVHPEVAHYLASEEQEWLEKFAKKEGISLLFHQSDLLHLNDFRLIEQGKDVSITPS